MPESRCPVEYIPWLLAHEYNFVPASDTMNELEEIADPDYYCLLASFEFPSNALFKFDRSWRS